MVTRADRLRKRSKNTTKSIDTVGKLRKLKKHFPELTAPLKPKPGFTKQAEEVQSTISNEEELRLQRVLTENPLSLDARLKLKREIAKREFRDDLSKQLKQDEAQFQMYFNPKKSESSVVKIQKVKKPKAISSGIINRRLQGNTDNSLLGFWEGTDSTHRRQPTEVNAERKEEVKKAFYNPTSGQSYNPSITEYKKALKSASSGESKVFNRLDNLLNQLTNRDDDITPVEPTQTLETTKPSEPASTAALVVKSLKRKKKILSLSRRKGLRQHKGDILRSLAKKKRAIEDSVNVSKVGRRMFALRDDFEKRLPQIREKRLKEQKKRREKKPVESSNDVMINSENDIDEAFSAQNVDDNATLSSVSSFREMQSGNSLQLWTSVTKRFHDTKSIHVKSFGKGHTKVGDYVI